MEETNWSFQLKPKSVRYRSNTSSLGIHGLHRYGSSIRKRFSKLNQHFTNENTWSLERKFINVKPKRNLFLYSGLLSQWYNPTREIGVKFNFDWTTGKLTERLLKIDIRIMSNPELTQVATGRHRHNISNYRRAKISESIVHQNGHRTISYWLWSFQLKICDTSTYRLTNYIN